MNDTESAGRERTFIARLACKIGFRHRLRRISNRSYDGSDYAECVRCGRRWFNSSWKRWHPHTLHRQRWWRFTHGDGVR